MPDRLTRPGTLAYAAVALLLAYEIVWLSRLDGFWAAGPISSGAVVALVGVLVVLYAVATATRTPVVGDGDRLLTRIGGVTVIGLTVVATLVVALGGLEEFVMWPTAPAVFAPFGIRRLEQAYFEGVDEARRERAAARAEDTHAEER
jgi:4-amino-4-deoxy-L-arabinose transferase-like glycosyltransferase